MSKDILYYPTIEFQANDYPWLWMASLLWDKVYRIVPDGYDLQEPRNIREICSTGEIGIALSPNKYSKKASDKFIENIENKAWQAAALEFNSEDVEQYETYSRLHKDKIDVTLRTMMLLNENIIENDDWMYVPREISNHFMVYLATEIAHKNGLSLNTHNSDIWTASTYFLYSDEVQPGFFPGKDYLEDSKAALVPLFLTGVFPENILDITPKQLLEFREKRKDERHQFNNAVDKFCNELSQTTDPIILKQIWHDEIKKMEYALTEYKKSMDILKVTKWGGYVTSLITVATNALGYTDFNSNVIKGLSSAGIGIGLLTGLLEKKLKPSSTPYSYLNSINSLMPTDFNRHNYKLYRKMEEFIND